MAKDIGKLVKEHALKNRPALYQWMHSHYAKLKPVLTQPRPSWKAVAQAAYEDGQKGEDGQPYSRQVAWKTWKQLYQDMQLPDAGPASRQKGETTGRERQPALLSPVPVPSSPPPVMNTPASPDRPRERKRMVLRSPVPLAEGEPAPNDGSHLPAPLRPEAKQ
jgi:hypothetical protein